MKKKERTYPFYLAVLTMAIITILSNPIKAQDPQFSQFYASSLYLNPAFTGNTTENRISGIYRNQWPSIPGAFISSSFSYDRNLAKVNSGIGIIVTHDKAGSAGLRYNNIGGLYSYAIQLNKKLMARVGTKFSYTFRNYDPSKLLFADQIIREGASNSIETNINQGISYADFSVGGLVYSKNYWGGFAFDHINQPNQSLLGDQVQLPIKFSLHGGYKFLLDGELETDDHTSISLVANYKAQLKWDQLDLGFYYTKNQLITGFWYRGLPLLKSYQPGYANNDALVLLIGLNLKGMRIGYTYDITISKLVRDTGGSHEISLTYEWPHKKKKKRKRFFVPCPKF